MITKDQCPSWKDFSEGFVISRPPQQYTIPELNGVTGRYVRIRPSLGPGTCENVLESGSTDVDNDPGYLSISQIQIFDLNGNNIALNKKVTATSTGGSPINQKYGKLIEEGAVYEFAPGVSADPSVVVDGTKIPRWGLTNIFETGTQNTSDDLEYLEIDLSGTVNIAGITYIGRGDPIRDSFTTYYGSDEIDQVTRLKCMRLEVYDSNRTKIYQTTFSDDPITHVVNIPINESMYTVNKGGVTTGLEVVSIPNVDSYKAIAKLFFKTQLVNDANKRLISNVNTVYNSVNIEKSGCNSEKGYCTSPGYTFDISKNIFQTIASDYPIQFYNYILSLPSIFPRHANADVASLPDLTTYGGKVKQNDPSNKVSLLPLVANSDVSIFGSPSAALTKGKEEMLQSIELCKNIYLGSPGIVENYIRMTYPTPFNPDNIKVYIQGVRNPGDKSYWCMPDIIQLFEDGGFVTKIFNNGQGWNTRFTREITPNLLSLLPYPTRNFMIEWIRDRKIRYIRHYNNSKPATTLTEDAVRSVIPPILIDIRSPVILDSIAQQFYELLGGDFSMTYIYDVLPVGATMLDIRFDLVVHTDAPTSYSPINDLKSQYNTLINNGKKLPQNIVDQATSDYQDKLITLQEQGITNTTLPFQGAVIRVFYDTSGSGSGSGSKTFKGAFKLTGIIFDKNAVTSFVPELNGGLRVPMGPEDGNINYKPIVVFTLNSPQSSLVCNNPDKIREVMNDYELMVNNDKSILLDEIPQVDTSKGAVSITKVLATSQVSPTQCVIDWVETVYDAITNKPMSLITSSTNYESNVCGYTDIRRRGLISYSINKEDWYAQDLVFEDKAGFKLFPMPQGVIVGNTTPIPECRFDPTIYNKSLGNRFTDSSSIINDFLVNGFKNGNGEICPQTIPKYTFNAANYVAANNLGSMTDDGAKAHYIQELKSGRNPPVRTSFTPTTLRPTVSYTKPLPAEISLTTANGICPTTSCTDLDTLYDIVTQYNSNPSLPGTIMNVQRAYTAGPNQCDIEAQFNFDSMINDILPQTSTDPVTGLPNVDYPMIKKGTVAYTQSGNKTIGGSKSMTLSGIQTVSMAIYVDIDKSNCSYLVADASGVGTGHTIQANTPYLYKSLNYSLELQNRTAATVGSSVATIQSDFSLVSGSSKQALKNYRVNTYSAQGSINTLKCPNSATTCSSLAVTLQNNYNATRNPTIQSITKVGTFNSNTCDLTVIDSTNQVKGFRFVLDSNCGVTNVTPIVPAPTFTDVQNMAVPLTTAPVSGFTDYHKIEYTTPVINEVAPLKERGFGLDRTRNSTETLKEIQFTQPLEQEFPIKEEYHITTYKFLRFIPLKTRDPNSFSVAVHRFTFYYQGKPLLLTGRVTNPMGTWEGDITDVTGPRATGWIDKHKKPLVFSFKDSIAIDAYSLTTNEKYADEDPVSWKLESSENGTFWTLLDSQTRFSTPNERMKETVKIRLTK